jgi:hypothetical protein
MEKLYEKMASEAPTGEASTGFIKGRKRGPYECGNCVHMEGEGICIHPVMIEKSNQPKKGKGVAVDERDCCRFQRRPGD